MSRTDAPRQRSWTEAGRKVLRFHLARMLAHMPGIIAGDDPEEVRSWLSRDVMAEET